MWRHLFLACLFAATGAAQAVTLEEVIDGAGRIYRDRIREMASRHTLDTDPAFKQRVERIAGVLMEQAKRDYPEIAQWPWEIHTTTDHDENAFGMAGGRILVGQAYVNELGLTDAELAMLLAHEMQHAIQKHNLKEFHEALRLDPSWRERPYAELEDAIDNNASLMRKLETINIAQEAEADREGMLLAVRAGWPPKRLASYFKKSASKSRWSNFDTSSHPSPSRRWQEARALANQLESSLAPSESSKP
jgi:predicted Zn-dependent protease